MTEKLFEQNALLKECEAVVLSCEQLSDHYSVVLNQTVIFPEGGGQLSDRGKINEVEVFYAADKAGEVWHYTKAPLPVGAKVKVVLNWDVRLDRMQQHTGEHLLSYAFWKTCGANNIGFHMNENLVTIDLDKEVTAEEVTAAENMANADVWANKPIAINYLPHEEVAKLTMRKKNENIHGILRVVSVENSDVCTCCGTHPPFTGMVGLVKVLKWEKHKGGTRIEFNCGARALSNMQVRNFALEETSNLLSVKVEDVPQAVNKLKTEVAELSAKNKEKTLSLFKAQLPELLEHAPLNDQGAKILFVVEELDAKEAKNLMQLLSAQEGVVVGIVAYNKDRVSYQFALGKNTEGDCRIYGNKANALFNGKGGGNAAFVQGGAAAPHNWLELAATLKENMA